MTLAIWLAAVAVMLIAIAGWKVGAVVFERDRRIEALTAQMRVLNADLAERDRRLDAQGILLRQAKAYMLRELDANKPAPLTRP